MVETYIMKIQVNVPTPKFVPTGGFVSKRNFLHNRPLVVTLQSADLAKLAINFEMRSQRLRVKK